MYALYCTYNNNAFQNYIILIENRYLTNTNIIREIVTCFIEQLLSITTFSVILFLTTVRVEKKGKTVKSENIYVSTSNKYFFYTFKIVCLFVFLLGGRGNSTKNAAELCVCIICFICLTQPCM